MKTHSSPALLILGCLLPLALPAAQPGSGQGGGADREIGPAGKQTWPAAGSQSAQERQADRRQSEADTSSRLPASAASDGETSLQTGFRDCPPVS